MSKQLNEKIKAHCENPPSRIRFSVSLFMVLVGVLFCTSCSQEQGKAVYSESKRPTVTSFVKGQEVFEKALAAHGGRANIQAIERIETSLEGYNILATQNQDLTHNSDHRTPRFEHLIYDYTKNWAYMDMDKFFGPDLHNGDRVYVMKGEGDLFVYYDETHTAQDNDPSNRLPGITFIEWTVPQLVLKKMIADYLQIRWAGQQSIGGSTFDVLIFPWSQTQVLNLYFNSETGFLERLSRPTQHNLHGDASIDYLFDYAGSTRDIDGFTVPSKLIIETAGENVIEENYSEVIFNGELDETLFERPDVPFVHMPPPGRPKLVKVNDNVVVVDFAQTRANVFATVLNDSIVVFEAPNNWFYSSQAAQLIKTAFPNMPFSYVVPSHFHDDHAGGVRAFIAEGATVITPTADKAYYEKIATATYTMFPDAVARNNIIATFEIVDDKRVFEDKKTGRKLEIINIGSPHSENMYISWLPNDGIVITADTFEYFEGHPVPVASNAAFAFANALKERGIEPDKILEGHSRPFYTLADLQEAVRLRLEEDALLKSSLQSD
jgi:glyoxylase-like metal-dependent hydrolase (beta-lactamase superfamily II)